MHGDKKKNTGLAAALWFLFIVILIIVFFIKKDTIITNLKTTDFFGRVFGRTPEFIKNHYEEPNSSVPQTLDINPYINTDELTFKIPPSEIISENGEIPSTYENPEEMLSLNDNIKTEISLKDVFLCFVSVDPDGTISRKTVKRSMPKTESPLKDAINALLEGPEENEKQENCISLIPSGTKLLSAYVNNNIATLNFNENFEFNPMGIEGCIAQLMQIVYTATEFPTVKSVQFLIEGSKQDYLGSEGQWIGSPLSRSNF